MKKGIIFILLNIALGLSSFAQNSIRLFHIDRNKNSAIVCYDLNLKDGVIDKNNPIAIYWSDSNKPTEKLNDLSSIQKKMAFGINVSSVSDNKVSFTMKAYNKKTITVTYNATTKTASPLTILDGKQARLQRLFVSASPPMYTSVDYVEFYGQSVQTKENLYEKITN